MDMFLLRTTLSGQFFCTVETSWMSAFARVGFTTICIFIPRTQRPYKLFQRDRATYTAPADVFCWTKVHEMFSATLSSESDCDLFIVKAYAGTIGTCSRNANRSPSRLYMQMPIGDSWIRKLTGSWRSFPSILSTPVVQQRRVNMTNNDQCGQERHKDNTTKRETKPKESRPRWSLPRCSGPSLVPQW